MQRCRDAERQGASRPQVGWGAARRCGGGSYISGVQAGCVEAIGEVGRKYKGQGLGQD